MKNISQKNVSSRQILIKSLLKFSGSYEEDNRRAEDSHYFNPKTTVYFKIEKTQYENEPYQVGKDLFNKMSLCGPGEKKKTIFDQLPDSFGIRNLTV